MMSTFTAATNVAASEGGPTDRTYATAASAIGVSVIVPMYNEPECGPRLVSTLTELERQAYSCIDFEFVLVDDGSTDDTVQRLETAVAGRPNFRMVCHANNRGIAAAIHTGLNAARHDIAVSMDCDGSYDAAIMLQMIAKLREGYDLVTASPYHPAGAVDDVPLWRLKLSRLASHLYGAACRYRLTCYTSCFRVYRRSLAAAIAPENPGFVGVAELLCKVLEAGGRVAEHPAMLRGRVGGKSKMRVIRASAGHLRLLGRILSSRLKDKGTRNRTGNDQCQ